MRHTAMKIGCTTLLAAGLSVLLAGCGGTAGQSVRRTVAASGFTAVSTGWGIDVEVATSTGWAVEVSADRQVVDRIIVEVRGSTLWIGLREGTLARARWLASQARVSIALPSLEQLEVAGGSQARLAMRQPGGSLAVVLSGGSSLSGSLACARPLGHRIGQQRRRALGQCRPADPGCRRPVPTQADGAGNRVRWTSSSRAAAPLPWRCPPVSPSKRAAARVSASGAMRGSSARI